MSDLVVLGGLFLLSALSILCFAAYKIKAKSFRVSVKIPRIGGGFTFTITTA
jgi:hypothetical protein